MQRLNRELHLKGNGLFPRMDGEEAGAERGYGSTDLGRQSC